VIHNYKLKEDEQRKRILQALGLDIIRFKNDEVENNLRAVLEN
jgi:very-short-patch-repair endonuclease